MIGIRVNVVGGVGVREREGGSCGLGVKSE